MNKSGLSILEITATLFDPFMKPFLTLLLLCSLCLTGCKSYDQPEVPLSATDKTRLVWDDDPTSTMTVIWDQLEGEPATVYYGTKDFGRAHFKYPYQQATNRVVDGYLDMHTCMAELSDLEADQVYYAVIKDAQGISERFWFRTAPDEPQAFTFIAGGDSKSGGLPLEAGRASNRMVAKLRPLFIQYNGDFTSGDGTNAERWHQWLTDWDTLTTTPDGRKFPIVAVQGNHENGERTMLNKLFNTPYQIDIPEQIYYSLSFGGDLFHIIVLNTEVDPGANQRRWLENDLKAHQDATFIIAGYHRPFLPHTRKKKENQFLYDQWADLFYEYGLDLSMDGDSHLHKTTYPLKPSSSPSTSEGFIRDDENGTVNTGEGSWGAAPRPVDAKRAWTLQSGSFNQFKWIHVHPDEKDRPAQMELFTVKTSEMNPDGTQTHFVDEVEALTQRNLFEIPENIELFKEEDGQVSVKIPFYLNGQ